MPDDKKKKSDDKASGGTNKPANELVGSSEFTETTGAYPVRLEKQPQRASGGFILEKFKDL